MKRDYMTSMADVSSFISTTSNTFTSMLGVQLFLPKIAMAGMKDIEIRFRAEVIGLSAATKAFDLEFQLNAIRNSNFNDPISFPPPHKFPLDHHSTKIQFEDYIDEASGLETIWLQWRVSHGTVMLGRRSFEVHFNLPNRLCQCSMQTIMAKGCQCGGV